jgi:hypothetical protein
LAGRGGPKAAGRAGKKVLLSSVREMAAFGGKRVKGAVKERKDRNGAAVPCGLRGAAGDWLASLSETTERQKRKREAARKRTRMAILGGRISKDNKATGGTGCCPLEVGGLRRGEERRGEGHGKKRQQSDCVVA